MANKSVVFKDGIITLKPLDSAPASLVKGLIWVDDNDGLPVVYNGTTSQKLVSVSATQTLTSKTLTSPVINSPTGLVKADVGLGNVDNTSDLNKPISIATQAVLDTKQPLASVLTEISALTPSNDDILQVKGGEITNRTPAQLKTDLTLTKADVGLGNVDNTSDATKNAATADLTNKTLVEPIIDNFLDINEESSPSSPPSNQVRLYAKTDKKLYYKDSDGNEHEIESTGEPEIELVYKKGSDYSGQTNTLVPQFPWGSPTRKSNPAALPAGASNDIAMSPNGEFVAIAHTTTPFVSIYQKQGITWVKLANPGTLPTAQGNAVAWSPNSEYLAVGHNHSTTAITIYQRAGSVFTKLAAVSSQFIAGADLPGQNVQDIVWSDNGEYLACAFNNTGSTPRFYIYRRTTGNTFTRLTNPSTLPTGNGRAIAFVPNRNSIVFIQTDDSTNPVCRVYDFSSTAIGTQVATLASGTIVVGTKAKISFKNGGKYFAVSGADGLNICSLVGNTLAVDQTLPLATSRGCKYSLSGKYLSATSDGSVHDRVIVYEITNDTTYTPLTILPSLTTSDHYGVDWSETTEWLVLAHQTTPFISFYQTGEDMIEEGIGKVIGQPRDGEVW
jgi:hypothetical protein